MSGEPIDLTAAGIDSLDDCELRVIRTSLANPSPGRINYVLRRINAELAPLGLRIEVRRRRHGRPPKRSAKMNQ